MGRCNQSSRGEWLTCLASRSGEDESWKGTGTCTDNYPGGKIYLTWEEGSQLKEYTYTKTGGTAKYEGVKGGGTYMYQNVYDTLSGGRYKGTIQLPQPEPLPTRTMHTAAYGH